LDVAFNLTSTGRKVSHGTGASDISDKRDRQLNRSSHVSFVFHILSFYAAAITMAMLVPIPLRRSSGKINRQGTR
jgi:hypothetical protein